MNLNNKPKRKYAGRIARMAIAGKWISQYNGKYIIKAYAKHFGIDKLCAIKELQMLGVEITEERKKQIINAHNTMLEARKKKKEEKAKLDNPLIDHDEDFSFIAGYTSNGFPYGTRWDEAGDISEDYNPSNRTSDESDYMIDDTLPF